MNCLSLSFLSAAWVTDGALNLESPGAGLSQFLFGRLVNARYCIEQDSRFRPRRPSRRAPLQPPLFVFATSRSHLDDFVLDQCGTSIARRRRQRRRQRRDDDATVDVDKRKRNDKRLSDHDATILRFASWIRRILTRSEIACHILDCVCVCV